MSRLFRGITDEARQLIMTSALPLNLKKGQRLFERGDPGGTMYVVVHGRIEISVVSEAGRKISLNLISVGNCFGEVNMIDNRDRTASAVALEPTSLQPIGRSTFFAAAQLCPELAITIAEILCERVRWMSDTVEDYALLSLDRRLARRLLLLHDQFSRTDGAIEIAQSELADFAGATRESTNKILMQWKSRGWISLQRRTIRLEDRAKLDQIAHETDAY
ncbi:MAG: Crp/Fnr family transcriptional regulator [Rhizobiales bacterium]|nr:Crp/Fnr family transcriptional regulator [Hyphomicrobiales bacterium]